MSKNGSEPGVNGQHTRTRRSDDFLAGLAGYKKVTFVSHVYPDPDSLGSMIGLAHLVETCLGKPTRLTRDLQINRAENRAMVDLLDIDLVPVEEIVWSPDQAVVMVDSQPRTGRHSFDPDGPPIYAVIDHHQTPGDLEDVPFTDVRANVGGTCSIVTRYIVEQEIRVPERVATALYYGIETELGGYPREASPLDDGSLLFLYPLIDKDILAKIHNAPLSQTFFECLLQALQSSFRYDRLIISWVNELDHPELTAQVCDLLIRHENIDWAVCAGVHEGRMLLSIRTDRHNVQAGEVLRDVVIKMGGKAGGHDRRAGGFIPLPSTSANAVEQVQADFRKRLLKSLGIDECRGQRLVSRKELLQNLHV